jgi:Domain of unknown function (DU1801)
MQQAISDYIQQLTVEEQCICALLSETINQTLQNAENKIWHAHPVWFLDGNPIVGFSKQKAGIRLMFWSGADFEENLFTQIGKKFKDASVFYQNANQINIENVVACLQKSKHIQWDYKNIVKRKGRLEKLVIDPN